MNARRSLNIYETEYLSAVQETIVDRMLTREVKNLMIETRLQALTTEQIHLLYQFRTNKASRVTKISVKGKTCWVKRPIGRNKLLKRLIIGSNQKSFDREMADHEELRAKKRPTPRVVFETV